MDDQEIVAKADAAIEAENYSEAVALLKPLVDRDNPKAMNSMGLLYQHGLGVPRDVQAAIALFEKAVTLGNGYAAHNLGTLYAIAGLDGQPEPGLSKRWYLRAHELGAVVAPESWYESLRQEGDSH